MDGPWFAAQPRCVRHVEVSVSQSAEGVVNSSRLPLWTRIAIAAPGAAAAALVLAGGVYFAVIGISDATSPSAGDDFASIPTTIAFVGVMACVLALLLAAATLIVSLARPRRVLLGTTAVFAGCGAACAVYLLATGADGIVYAPLTAVLAYLAVVAVLRLLPMRKATNA
jgi:hypothetical protein